MDTDGGYFREKGGKKSRIRWGSLPLAGK